MPTWAREEVVAVHQAEERGVSREHALAATRSPDIIRSAMGLSVGSADATVSDEGERPRIALMCDPRAREPIDCAVQREEVARLPRLLGILPDREQVIMRLRFGLGDEYGEPLTLKQVGAAVGLTRERVRQLVDQSLEKMRAAL